jgi:hypothetical protein
MKNSILAGAITGSIMGIANFALGITFSYIGVTDPLGGVWGIASALAMLIVLALLSLSVIWGTFFGAIYGRFFDNIPGKGVMKGLIYGLLVWIGKDVAAGSYVALIFMEISISINLILIGFFMWIIYGLILGYLYKPAK